MSELVSVTVYSAGEILIPWTVSQISETGTVNQLAQLVFSSDDAKSIPRHKNPFKHDGATFEVLVHTSKCDDKHRFQKVNKNLVVTQIVQIYGRYFMIEITPSPTEEETSSHPTSSGGQIGTTTTTTNAFDVLMSAAKQKSLPDKFNARNKFQELHNDIIDFLETLKIGFLSGNEQTGKHFVNAVTQILWYIGPHAETFSGRACEIPEAFNKFLSYNDPCSSKHRVKNIESVQLLSHIEDLERIIDQQWLAGEALRNDLIDLSNCLHKYVSYLLDKKQQSRSNRESEEQIRTSSQAESLNVLSPPTVRKPSVVARYQILNDHLDTVPLFCPVHLDEFTPDDSRERRYFIDTLPQAVKFKVVHYSYSFGNNMGTYHFLWKITEEDSAQLHTKNNQITDELRKGMPKFHTRQMRKRFSDLCGRVCNVKSSKLNVIYRQIVGDSSTPETENSKQVEERARMAISMEDPDIVVDLREHNSGVPTKYEIFFQKCKEYLRNVVELVCDDRRHDKFTYLATAVSTLNLREKVTATCPLNTPIPSEQWLRLQFSPKRPSSVSSLQFTGKLDIRFMVQSRVFRKQHIDDHYCAALFRYMREMAILFRNNTNFICQDDKHFCKVGEPGCPVSATERGKQVLVAGDRKLVVADHDFTKTSIIPSVTMMIDIPEAIQESFYRGQVFVGVKDHVFESSSPLRHVAELYQILKSPEVKPILLLYTDGGPDHRLTYSSVQACLICLFRALNLDLLCAGRTAPNASWRNPPERIMSILNLGLNCVGLMRQEMSDVNEQLLKSCNNIKDIRDAAEKQPGLKDGLSESLVPVKTLLNDLFSQLSLKDKKFNTFDACSEDQMDMMWSFVQDIDGTIDNSDRKSNDLKSKKQLQAFVTHCCTVRHYSFTIKKCEMPGCEICLPRRLPVDVHLHRLPDPVPDSKDEMHYKPFNAVYGTATTEDHQPSLQQKIATGHGLPFSPSAQTAKTVRQVLVCTECEKPRVLYSEKKLPNECAIVLNRLLDYYQYSCGACFQDLRSEKAPRVNAVLDRVYVRGNLKCSNDVEIPYFSSGVFADVCIKCGKKSTDLLIEEGAYPICRECKSRFVAVLKRKRNLHVHPQQNKSKR